MVKAGKLLRSLIRAGTRTAKLFAAASKAATAPPKSKTKARPKRTPAKPRPVPMSTTPTTASPRSAATPMAGKPRSAVTPTAAKPRTAAARVVAKPRLGGAVRRAVVQPGVAPGKWLSSYVLTAAGQRMSYWLYLPNSFSERAIQKGLPLVVMLHGCQQTATQFAQGTRMNQWAEKLGYAILYPQQLVSSHPQRCWKWYDRSTQEGGGDVPTIISILRKVLAQYTIDRSRVYVAGISAGAGMANILALNHPELFAAVGLHSGPVFGAGHSTLGALAVMKNGGGLRTDLAAQEILQRQPPFPGMPAILLQGENDDIVRPINQLQLARQSLLLNRLADEAKITHKPQGRHNAHRLHDFYTGRKLMLRVAQIEQLGHAWSGGDPALAFNAKAGPDASKMLLEFFARHQRDTA